MASLVCFKQPAILSPLQQIWHGSTSLAQTHLTKTPPTSANPCLCSLQVQWMVKKASRRVASIPSRGFVSQLSSAINPKNAKQSLGSKVVLRSQDGGGLQAGLESSSIEEAPMETLPRESVTHVASESALESPEKVHKKAQEEARLIAAEADGSVEQISENLEKEADQAARKEADESPARDAESTLEIGASSAGGADSAIKLQDIQETVMVAAKEGIRSAKAAMESVIAAGGQTKEGYERAREVLQPHIETASQILEGVMDSGRHAREYYGSVKGAVDKRLKALAQATEEARDVSTKAVEMARKRWEDLRQHAEELHGYAIEMAEQMDKDSQPDQSITPEDEDQSSIPEDEDQREAIQNHESK